MGGRGARAGVGDLALVAADAGADENRHEERGCIGRRAARRRGCGFLAPVVVESDHDQGREL